MGIKRPSLREEGKKEERRRKKGEGITETGREGVPLFMFNLSAV